jgi:hypothetical protein
MHTEAWLAYCGYLVWLSAGLCDFLCHRRADLPHTSGVAESVTHLLQLALLGAAIVVGLAFETGRATTLLLIALVAAHALIGYIDTRIAFGRRRTILPVEQHIHSVLDMAPIIALAWLVTRTWPAAVQGGWDIAWRTPALPMGTWIAVLLPAVVLCVLPAILEFRAATAAKAQAPALP